MITTVCVCVRACVRVSVCVCGVVWCGVVWCGVVWWWCVCVCDVFEMYDNNILSNVVARVVSTPSSQEP